jgi:hypothetical protein
MVYLAGLAHDELLLLSIRCVGFMLQRRVWWIGVSKTRVPINSTRRIHAHMFMTDDMQTCNSACDLHFVGANQQRERYEEELTAALPDRALEVKMVMEFREQLAAAFLTVGSYITSLHLTTSPPHLHNRSSFL